ncbi:SurA N-terminal domain-containing protein [Brevibacillus agri]|uniref:SurA N-terminal domain-containing protein n=1 Tax=Brevibacillus TaxID=55080 RepID=UPI00027190A2|nr:MULTISPECIES: SurA N-terminal domain-containing protein [Brevibacillus]ELK39103.1 hypothetical protein D478_26177 [Brevibacillus agri BAB-2500]EJL43557.1 hypothetical protein PMI08_02570 [Brevibacillus sp. CF112]MBG9567194.1 hypothetical protein [Brevibacillus agri]MBY0054833.1 SurA N-terminal domain-containing protein [Brevibacillus agri]MCG5254367.1 SurA N-terminal domain-containing protein [Brevibacillus agri]
MKKLSISLSLLTVLGSALAISSFATNEQTEVFKSLKEEIVNIKSTKESTLVQVENESITDKEFKIYKAYMKANQKLNKASNEISDNDLLTELVMDELLVQEAENQGVSVSLNTAKEYSIKMKEILENADEKSKEFQRNAIEVTGLSEDKYWEEYAPDMYRKQLSTSNLVEKLVKDGVLPNAIDNLDDFNKAFEKYKKELYKKASKKVKVLNDEVQLQD